MKKSAMLIVTVVLVATVGSMLGASAGHCGSGTDRAHDPFGSCENGTPGHLECGSGTTIPGVGTITTTPSSGTGAQACADDSSALPIAGRAGVWVQSDGTVTVFADGDDVTNSSGGSGWDRVDVNAGASSCRVHYRHGDAGQWANHADGSTNSSTTTDQCAG